MAGMEKEVKALFFLLLISTSVFADFNGSFSGSGEAIFASGRRYQCSEIFLRLETSAELFRLREGGYKCGGFLNASFDPFKLRIRDGRLYHKDQELGLISEKEMEYQIYDPEDGSTYFLSLKWVDEQLLYSETWHDGKKIALVVRGTLKRIH
jgi:hypothetical protein